ncbi:MAG: TetR family transcriptional regulator [Phenylobacterium zucineum]|nr:MAG: TetR family transcriptional regulator [Phenylobacterium zucineum]
MDRQETGVTAKRGRPRQAAGESENTGERVRRAALELFARQGFHGTGIRDIAEAAGLKTATLYHYMGNKDDLLVEIMVGAISPLNAAAARVLADQDDPAAQLAQIVEQHVWSHARDRLQTLVSDTEVRALTGKARTEVLALRDAYEGAWRQAVENGVGQGLFETGAPALTARALLQMATGVSHWFSPRGPLKLEALCAEYADWSLGMVRAAREGRPIRRADLALPRPDHYLSAAG